MDSRVVSFHTKITIIIIIITIIIIIIIILIILARIDGWSETLDSCCCSHVKDSW